MILNHDGISRSSHAWSLYSLNSIVSSFKKKKRKEELLFPNQTFASFAVKPFDQYCVNFVDTFRQILEHGRDLGSPKKQKENWSRGLQEQQIGRPKYIDNCPLALQL